MSGNRRRVPAYRLHKPSGQARVIIDGAHVYLGKHGSPESWEKYHRLVAERLGPRRALSRAQAITAVPGISMNELILAFWRHVRSYYVKNGRPTDEQAGIRSALRFVRRLYGSTPAREFGPMKLKAVRQAMMEADLSRGVINQYVGRVRRMFRWGVENELIPVDVYQALLTVGGLRKDRSEARETTPVEPALDKHVDATLPHLTEVVRAMVQFQRLTGCRPQEVCLLRPCDVDMRAEIWVHEPTTHKGEHRGRTRRVCIGPKAQAVLRPWLDRAPDAYCFSPRESAEAFLAKRRNGRVHDLPSRSRRRHGRAPGEHYTRYSYRQAVERACKRAGVPKWTPNQLRHSRGTEVRRQYGLEGSQVVLGHARADVAQVYAEKNQELAIRIARETG